MLEVCPRLEQRILSHSLDGKMSLSIPKYGIPRTITSLVGWYAAFTLHMRKDTKRAGADPVIWTSYGNITVVVMQLCVLHSASEIR
jgi:hypothetical protein